MTWRAMAWQILLATSQDAIFILTPERGSKVRVDDVAGSICLSLLGG